MFFKTIYNPDKFVIMSNSHDDTKSVIAVINKYFKKEKINKFLHFGDIHDINNLRNINNILVAAFKKYGLKNEIDFYNLDIEKVLHCQQLSEFVSENDIDNVVKWLNDWVLFRKYLTEHSNLNVDLIIGNHDWYFKNHNKWKEKELLNFNNNKSIYQELLSFEYPNLLTEQMKRIYSANTSNNLANYNEYGIEYIHGNKKILLTHELTYYPKKYFGKLNEKELNRLWRLSRTPLKKGLFRYQINKKQWQKNRDSVIAWMSNNIEDDSHRAFYASLYPLGKFLNELTYGKISDFRDFSLSYDIYDNEYILGNCFYKGIQKRNIFDYDYIIFGHYHKAVNVLVSNGYKKTRIVSSGALVSNSTIRDVYDDFSAIAIVDFSKEVDDPTAVIFEKQYNFDNIIINEMSSEMRDFMNLFGQI